MLRAGRQPTRAGAANPPTGNAAGPAGNAAGPAGNAAGPAGNAVNPAGDAADPAGDAGEADLSGVTVDPISDVADPAADVTELSADVADLSADTVDLSVDSVDLSAALAAAQRGDDESFRMIYRAVQPLLLRYLHALVNADAEDVASETWLQIARDLHSFRGDYDGFRGWAATIARHRAMDHVRRVRRRPSTAVPVEELSELAGDADPASQALDALSTRAAIDLIASLPRDQAEAVLLRVVMNLDTATTARVLGKRVGAVRTAAYRGLHRLAERLR